MFFYKIPILLSLRPIVGHPLSMKITGFMPLGMNHQSTNGITKAMGLNVDSGY